MTNFSFREIDAEGHETLNVISTADRLNQWMFESIKPFVTGNVIEIGSGIGNISEYFLNAGLEITLTDIRSNYCNELSKKFSHYKNLKEVTRLDLTNPDFDVAYAPLLNSFDTLFALNVIEHISDDNLAIYNCRKLLKTGGRIIILVPAYQRLYNSFDKNLEHYRRYTKKSAANLIVSGKFSIISNRYFNFAGIFGWFFSGTIQKNKTIPEGQIKIYNSMVPLFKVVDSLIFKSAGLSVICVGKKS